MKPPVNTKIIPPRNTIPSPPKRFDNSPGDKKRNASLTIVLILLTLAFLSSSVVFMKQKIDVEKKLTKEKEELVKKFESLKLQLTEVSAQNTTLQESLDRQSKTITNYIDSLKVARRISKSLAKYKSWYFSSMKQTKAMIRTNDSLIKTIQGITDQRNKLLDQLKGQLVSNDSLKDRLSTISKKLQDIPKVAGNKKNPENKKNSSSKGLPISDVNINPVSKKLGKEVSVTSLRKATRLKVCFNVGETADVEPGNVKFFLKVVDPKNRITGVKNKNSKSSASKSVYYANQKMDVCIYVNRVKKFTKGIYKTSIMDEKMNVIHTKKILLD